MMMRLPCPGTGCRSSRTERARNASPGGCFPPWWSRPLPCSCPGHPPPRTGTCVYVTFTFLQRLCLENQMERGTRNNRRSRKIRYLNECTASTIASRRACLEAFFHFQYQQAPTGYLLGEAVERKQQKKKHEAPTIGRMYQRTTPPEVAKSPHLLGTKFCHSFHHRMRAQMTTMYMKPTEYQSLNRIDTGGEMQDKNNRRNRRVKSLSRTTFVDGRATVSSIEA